MKEQIEYYIDYLKEEPIKVKKNVLGKSSKTAIDRKISALTFLFNYLTTETENEEGECYFYRNVISKIKITRSSETASRRSKTLSSKILHDDTITDFLNFCKIKYENSTDGIQTKKIYQK